MKRFTVIACLCIGAAGVVVPVMSSATVAAVERDLPTADEVFEKAVKAVGGRSALDKVKTLHTVMTMEMAGQSMKMDCSWSRAGGRLVKMIMPMGEMVSGTDGTTAWRKTPMGYGLLDNDETLGMARMHMMVDPTTRDKDDMKDAEVVGKESFEGKDCYKLKYTQKGKPIFMYFDASTGLPVGSMQDDSGGTTKSILADWKEVNGVKFFHVMRMESSGDNSKKMGGPMNGEAKVELLEVNTVDAKAFELPPEVAKLKEAKQSDTGAAAGVEIKLEDLSPAEQKEAKQMVESLGSMDVKMLKQMESSMGMGIDYMPENKKKTMKFFLQEIRKEIKKRG